MDHLPLDDFVPYALTANTFDQARGNSGFPDTDGNFIFSFPSTSEVMKVNRTTGEVMWRLGGRHNEFLFDEPADELGNRFSFQHKVHRLANGNILIFDNGLTRKPQYSRVVEYKIDETAKTCNKIWEYRHEPDIVTNFGGGAQRLPNGNTLVNWGMLGGVVERTVSEVTADKRLVYELSIPRELICYRVSKFDTNMCDAVATKDWNETLEGNKYPFKSGKDTLILTYFERLDAFIYNTISFKKFDCPPVDADFEGKAPYLYPLRFEITGLYVDSFKAIMNFNTKMMPEITNPEKSVIFYRDTVGTGKFKPLVTEYDADSKELIITTYNFGEFVIGVNYDIHIPIKPNLVEPENKAKVDVTKPVTLKWALLGYAKSSELQVSEDSEFQNLVLDSMGLFSALIKLDNLKSGQTYYWRTKSFNEDGVSEWSDAWNFTPKEPFISMIYPNGGEVIIKDTSKHIIRWDKNTLDTVRIQLFKNGQPVYMMRDSFYTTTNAYAWTVSKTVPVDSIYKIRITSISNSAFFTESEDMFSIKTAVGVEEVYLEHAFSITNYPNPSNGITSFEFILPESGNVSLEIFDITGIKAADVLNERLEQGVYRVDWDASMLLQGIYIYRLKSGNFSSVNKLTVIR